MLRPIRADRDYDDYYDYYDYYYDYSMFLLSRAGSMLNVSLVVRQLFCQRFDEPQCSSFRAGQKA